MRIAYVIPGCGVSGGVAVVCQHANRLLRRGHDVYLISDTPQTEITWFPGQRVPVLRVDQFPADVDILIATGWSTAFRAAALPARAKCYFVQSDETRFHEPDSVWQHITRLSYTFGFNYLTEARWVQTWLADKFGKHAELAPNGIDESMFFPSEPLAPRSGRKRVLLEGAIDLPYKGMAEAFAAVAAEDVDVWCVSSFGRPKRGWRYDRFFNEVEMSMMRRIYSSCDILLKLSRVEGFFGPPMEMMACGGAVIVGRVTGYDEYIQDDVNALVVDPLDVAEAAGAVRRLSSDAALRARLIAAGAETASRWRWEPTIDILERFYRGLLDGGGVPYSVGQQEADGAIAGVYRQLRGEVVVPTPSGARLAGDSGEVLEGSREPVVILPNPTEKLLARLATQRWFHLLARVIYRVHLGMRAVKARVR